MMCVLSTSTTRYDKKQGAVCLSICLSNSDSRRLPIGFLIARLSCAMCNGTCVFGLQLFHFLMGFVISIASCSCMKMLMSFLTRVDSQSSFPLDPLSPCVLRQNKKYNKNGVSAGRKLGRAVIAFLLFTLFVCQHFIHPMSMSVLIMCRH